MAAAGVPTAGARTCTTAAEVDAALDAFGPPYVVKDDGLAAGKGVVVTHDREAARAHAAACGTVVVEEYLDGPEVSLFCVTDGEARAAAAAGAGRQAGRRRRHRSEHRRHGRVCAAALGARPTWSTTSLHAVVAPDAGRDAPPRHPVRRPALRRPRAHRGRPAGNRVQRAVRRPGDPGGARAAGDRRWPACCTPPRPARSSRTRRCAGATAPRSPWCSPPPATRVSRGPATCSPAPTGPACCTPAPAAATTARWWRSGGRVRLRRRHRRHAGRRAAGRVRPAGRRAPRRRPLPLGHRARRGRRHHRDPGNASRRPLRVESVTDSWEQDFAAYVDGARRRPARAAYLLCGDWHAAEDLTQAALTKLYLAWRRIDRTGSLDAYARRVLLRTYLDERRRPWRREHPVAGGPAGLATTARSPPRGDPSRTTPSGTSGRRWTGWSGRRRHHCTPRPCSRRAGGPGGAGRC